MGSIKPCAVWGFLLAGTGYRQRLPTWVLCPLIKAMALARVPTALGGKVTVKGALGVSVERARARSDSTRHSGKIGASSDDWSHRV
jgi:hypothetical protein